MEIACRARKVAEKQRLVAQNGCKKKIFTINFLPEKIALKFIISAKNPTMH